MIPGDEHKPMSILEFISDEPCDVEPYIDYLLEFYQKHFIYWSQFPNPSPVDIGCVLIKIEGFIIELEKIKRKMNRPK